MEEDKHSISFADSLYTNLWYSQNIISRVTATKPEHHNSEFIDEVSRAVLVLSSLTAPAFFKRLESFFSNHSISRINVFTFLSTYCFEYHAKYDDIFEVVLNTCTFAFSTMLFCRGKGHPEYIDFGSMCWVQVFNYILKEDFYNKGGWEELERYVKVNCTVPKNKTDSKDKYIDFRTEINHFFQNSSVTDEEECVYLPGVAVTSANPISNAKEICTKCEDQINPQDAVDFVSTSMCEAKIPKEEAVTAYKLLTNFYGQNCESNGDEASDETLSSEIIDMEHVYKTLTNFINEGMLEVEAATGKFIQPSLMHDADLQKELLCCRTCQQDEQNVISNDALQAMIQISSLVNKIIGDGSKICKVECESQSNTR